MGIPTASHKISKDTQQWNNTHDRLRYTTPKQVCQAVLSSLITAEQRAADEFTSQVHQDSEQDKDPQARGRALMTKEVNRWTTIPTPTQDEWNQALQDDPDTRLLITTLKTGLPLDKAKLLNKRYYDEYIKGKLDVEKDTLYQYEEPKVTKIRQLRRRVVPKSMRTLITTAYHATPLAGHSGLYKTHFRIAARYFWPGMATDI